MNPIRKTFSVEEAVDFRPPEGLYERRDLDGYSMGWFKHVDKSAVFFAHYRPRFWTIQVSLKPLMMNPGTCAMMELVKNFYSGEKFQQLQFRNDPILSRSSRDSE